MILNEEQCNNLDEFGIELKCIWIESQFQKCVNVQDSCYNITTPELCETSASDDGPCIWIEDLNTKCQTVQKSCGLINNMNVCLGSGIVINDKGSVECQWVEGKCIDKVKVLLPLCFL
jgi:hypothetical protein